MTRIARVVAPGVPHHITQRGNRRQQTFFCEADYTLYKSLMAERCRLHNVQIWSYCLMPNHVHLIAVPDTESSLRAAIGEAHRRYTALINKRNEWTGCLWQGRFFSYPMDESHMLMTGRYIELNPVRAGLTARPEDYQWGSAKNRVKGKTDSLVKDSPLSHLLQIWGEAISDDLDEEVIDLIRKHERTGRPCGSSEFIEQLEMKTGRVLKVQKPGRPCKSVLCEY